MQSKPTLLLLACLSACSDPTSQQQARLIEILTVACNVDGAIVPVAQPIVATMGSAGATASNIDLLLHPAVVAACQELKGIPASVAAVAPVPPVAGSVGNSQATPTGALPGSPPPSSP